MAATPDRLQNRENATTGFPTVLVAERKAELREAVVGALQQEGYLVLIARDGAEALDVGRVHSRQIHLIITGADVEGRALAATLKPFRPAMAVLFVDRSQQLQDLDNLLIAVRSMVQAPPRRNHLTIVGGAE